MRCTWDYWAAECAANVQQQQIGMPCECCMHHLQRRLLLQPYRQAQLPEMNRLSLNCYKTCRWNIKINRVLNSIREREKQREGKRGGKRRGRRVGKEKGRGIERVKEREADNRGLTHALQRLDLFRAIWKGFPSQSLRLNQNLILLSNTLSLKPIIPSLKLLHI